MIIGQKKPILAYSNDGKDYEVITPFEYIIAIVVGSIFIIIPMLDFFAMRKRRSQQASMEEIIHQRREAELAKQREKKIEEEANQSQQENK